MVGALVPVPVETKNATILIVDDEQEVIEAVGESLRDLPCSLLATTNPRHALTIIRAGQPLALLITDLFMPSMSGGQLLREARRIRPALPALLLTGVASQQEFIKWRRRGEYIVGKPWFEDELISTIGTVLSGAAGKCFGNHAAD
jgi:CheY-like chemotaxis protein